MDIHAILEKNDCGEALSFDDILVLLQCRHDDVHELYAHADQIRHEYMGDAIYLRGIIEFSNYCVKDCAYCGIQKSHSALQRYRMSVDEIIGVCKRLETFGQTTVVLQSGEDPFYTKEKMGALISAIKTETRLAVTLSVGERDAETYAYWQSQGMDRYLLRFETAQPHLFKACHGENTFATRVSCLHALRQLGVQTGSGFLIGIPGETIEDLACDIMYATDLDLDMIGVGPFIPHAETPFGAYTNPFYDEIFYKVIAILRLLNKDAHIPSTTAFDAIDPNGRNLLLERGANVFMPNATPKKYRDKYVLYPGKPCVDEDGDECAMCVMRRINALGRIVGTGPGHSIKKHAV